jgi:hypothetical protein
LEDTYCADGNICWQWRFSQALFGLRQCGLHPGNVSRRNHVMRKSTFIA